MHHRPSGDDRVVANGDTFEDQAVTADPHVVLNDYRFAYWWSLTVDQDYLVEVRVGNVTVPRDGTSGANLYPLTRVDDRAVANLCAFTNVQVCWLILFADDSNATARTQQAYTAGGETAIAFVDDYTAPH